MPAIHSETLQLIRNRRSIRTYTGQSVERDLMEHALVPIFDRQAELEKHQGFTVRCSASQYVWGKKVVGFTPITCFDTAESEFGCNR